MISATEFAVPAAFVLTGLGAGIGALAAPIRWVPGVVVQRQSAARIGPSDVGAPGRVWHVGLSASF